MDIGNVMHVRRQTGRSELVVVTDKAGDNAEIQTVKELIRRAMAVRPEDRPTAAWILEQLNTVGERQTATRLLPLLKVIEIPYLFLNLVPGS